MLVCRNVKLVRCVPNNVADIVNFQLLLINCLRFCHFFHSHSPVIPNFLCRNNVCLFSVHRQPNWQLIGRSKADFAWWVLWQFARHAWWISVHFACREYSVRLTGTWWRKRKIWSLQYFRSSFVVMLKLYSKVSWLAFVPFSLGTYPTFVHKNSSIYSRAERVE